MLQQASDVWPGGAPAVPAYVRIPASARHEIPVDACRVRRARRADAAAIARIYNQAIVARTATFETSPRTVAQIESLLVERGDRYPAVVVERGHAVVGWAGSSQHSQRPCFAGIAEFSVYVDRAAHRTGVGYAALSALIVACESRGFWKLISRIFVDNLASRSLCGTLGFREVGVLLHHAPVDGIWRDAVLVEKLLGVAR